MQYFLWSANFWLRQRAICFEKTDFLNHDTDTDTDTDSNTGLTLSASTATHTHTLLNKLPVFIINFDFSLRDQYNCSNSKLLN